MSKEPESKYRNYYRCEKCKQEWEECWDSMCDGVCPQCGKSYTPYKSDDLTPNPMPKELNDAVQTIFDYLNRMGLEKEVTYSLLMSVQMQHRTLKQNFMRCFLKPIIVQFAKDYDEGRYDMRNEETVVTCVKLRKVLEGSHFPFI